MVVRSETYTSQTPSTLPALSDKRRVYFGVPSGVAREPIDQTRCRPLRGVCITERTASAHPSLRGCAAQSAKCAWKVRRLSALCRAALSAPGVICEPLVILGDPQHHLPRFQIRELVGDAARFLGALEPVSGIVENGAGYGHLHGPRAAKRRNDTVQGGVAQHVDRRYAYVERMPPARGRMPEARQ